MAARALVVPSSLPLLRFNARGKFPLRPFKACRVVEPPLTTSSIHLRRRIHTSGGFTAHCLTDPTQSEEPEPERHLKMIFKVVKDYLEGEELILTIFQLPHGNEVIPMEWSYQHHAWSAEADIPMSCPLLFSLFYTKDRNGVLKSTPSLPKMYQANTSLKSISVMEEWARCDDDVTVPEDPQRSVPVSFSVSKEWVEGEELYLSIGEEWRPSKTIPMHWSGEDKSWCAHMEVPVEKQHYFNYLVKKQGSELLFKPPTPHRHLKTWNGLKKMTVAEEWLPTHELAEVWESGWNPTREGYVSDED